MRRQEGVALVEAILLGLILIVPLIWLLGMLAEVQRGALAATSAAREAALDAARSSDLAGAARAVDDAVARALADHGLDPSQADVTFAADRGLDRGGQVEVVVRYPVSVLQAPLLGEVAGPSVWIDARNVTRIEPFASR